MKAMSTLIASSLLICHAAFAVTMYYPGNTDGTTAVEQAAKPPQYYPPQKTNPENPNPNLPRQNKPNSNLQGNIKMPAPAPQE